MMDRSQVPEATIERLPIYLRCLMHAQAMRMPLINSAGLAEMAGTNAAQVRKDLSYLGELGTRGIGYDVGELIGHICRWLGLSQSRHVAIVGYGRLGQALLGYGGFQDRGFSVVAVFDSDPDKIGKTTDGGLVVHSMEDIDQIIESEKIEIAVLAVPVTEAQLVADGLVASGVRAILDFAPTRLEVPEDVTVRYVDLSVELQVLSFYLNTRESGDARDVS